MEIQMFFIFCMELIGTVAFAASGAMTGIHCGMDLFGVGVLGVTTAVGGGMLRDVILGRIPGALLHPVYVAVALFTSLAVFLILYLKKSERQTDFGLWYDRILLVMDSIGLGIFTAAGVISGIQAGYLGNTFLLAFLGTLTGVGGGLMRDVLSGQPPYIFVKHIYACASVAGALSCIWLYRGVGQLPAMGVASLVVIAIRLLAAFYRWNLPRITMEIKH